MGILAPGEGRMAVDQHTRNLQGVQAEALEGFDNHIAGFQLVGAFNLRFGHVAGAGHLAVEIIRVGGPQRRDASPRLGPCRCPRGMGMHNAADAGKSLVQRHMGSRIGGRLVVALHRFALQIHHYHMLRLHHVIRYAAWFNNHQAAFPVDTAYIPPGKGDQAVFGQVQIGLQHLFLQLFQHIHSLLS
ncbi:hypothetical protein D3C75_787790 [compost metagenome]